MDKMILLLLETGALLDKYDPASSCQLVCCQSGLLGSFKILGKHMYVVPGLWQLSSAGFSCEELRSLTSSAVSAPLTQGAAWQNFRRAWARAGSKGRFTSPNPATASPGKTAEGSLNPQANWPEEQLKQFKLTFRTALVSSQLGTVGQQRSTSRNQYRQPFGRDKSPGLPTASRRGEISARISGFPNLYVDRYAAIPSATTADGWSSLQRADNAMDPPKRCGNNRLEFTALAQSVVQDRQSSSTGHQRALR